MATTDGIAGVSEGIRLLLTRAKDAAPAASSGAEVRVVKTTDLQGLAASDEAVVSVLLHRVMISNGRRTFPPGRTDDDVELLPPLPLDLSFLITAWATDALTQQRLLGWAVRALADDTSLPSTLLNSGLVPAPFSSLETVELDWLPLTEAEEADIWQIAQTARQPSASYTARMLLIDSRRPAVVAEPAQTRVFATTHPVPQ